MHLDYTRLRMNKSIENNTSGPHSRRQGNVEVKQEDNSQRATSGCEGREDTRGALLLFG